MLSAIFGSQGTPQLIKATLQNNLEFLKKNSKHLAEVRDLDGRSLLHIASSEGHVEIVKYLLTLRLDPNLVDKDGYAKPVHEFYCCFPGLIRWFFVYQRYFMIHCIALHFQTIVNLRLMRMDLGLAGVPHIWSHTLRTHW
jgi:hypothetical protein